MLEAFFSIAGERALARAVDCCIRADAAPIAPVTGRRVETGAILRRPALEDRPDG
jgi:hypothetical protein